MPHEAIPSYLAGAVNRALKTTYGIEDIRSILSDERDGVTSLDLTIALELGEIWQMRATRRLKRPDAKKNPNLAVLLELLNQGF